MKQLLLILLLMFSVVGYSQTINPPSSVVGVGFGVLKGETVVVDSLNFQDGWVLLMQDNSTLIVNESLNGNGIITYGDVGDDIPKSQLVQFFQDVNGVDVPFWRESTDVNPKIIFTKCVNPNMTFGRHIDVSGPTAPTIAGITPDEQIYLGESRTLIATGGTEFLWDNGETTSEITVTPTETTTYSVTVTNPGQCPTTVQTTLTVIDAPIIVVNAGDDITIMNGDNVTLIAISIGTTTPTYNWSNGGTTQSITVSPTTDTVYSVVISEYGNTDTDSVTVRVNN